MAVYRRTDAYYVARYDQTSQGVWLLSAGPATQLPLDSSPGDLGLVLGTALTEPTSVVAHPRQPEWTGEMNRRRTALLHQAKVRSWKAFVAGSTSASVDRDGVDVVVTRQVRDARRSDVWGDDDNCSVRLTSPNSIALGRAAAQALASSDA